MWKTQSKNAPSWDRLCRWTNQISYPSQLLEMMIFSVDESGKSIVNLDGKSGKTISIGCRFPPKFANSQPDSLLTATHSLRSSPSGSWTASRRLPEPSVAAACFIKSYWWVPSAMFFFGLKVLLERPPLSGLMSGSAS